MAATATLLLPTSTPPEYHRIVSEAVHIPTDPTTPVPVGILACQRDPLLRELKTNVVSCMVHQPPPAPAGKKAKKAVIAPTLPDDPILEVILQDTVIFPEGGGQPTDTGIITTNDGTVWQVVQAKRHGGHGVHYVKVHGDVNVAISAFTPGSSVTVALDQAGFDRRYDHMSMHTSQHLLSALLETRLGLPTLSWSLTSYPTPCYVEIPRGMIVEEILSIQNEANRLVFEGRKVHVEVRELDREQEQGVQKLESGRAVGKALPDDYTGGVKRVVVIDGVDRNPCCGTHMPSLHNLQLFLLPHTDSLSRSTTTSARLYFLAGPRLIAHLTTTHSLLSSTASVLSCGMPLVPERVTQVIDERRRAEKRVGEVEIELARSLAKEFAAVIGPHQEGLFKQHIHRLDDSANALGFLSTVAFAITDTIPNTQKYLIIVTSSPSGQNASSTSVALVVGSDEKLVKAVGEGLKSKLGIKGGGKGPRWTGKWTGVWKESKENAVVQEILETTLE
ncbi:ThrRS/AlaRS common domain-containing protein [Pluteus cervinus]|uniref:ThrRS/AlaRS common domain-containing protein n=1 Tax=Pluteus cervinus TaxID=181527 RepID=A0ACD3BDP1_9AGAR|nr:ThrRS/AlaRS common domain-containing protein [Pluteus cervinus]